MMPLLLAVMSLASSTITPDIDVAPRGSLEVNSLQLARLRDFLQSFSAISPPKIERGRWGILGWLPTVSFRFELPDPKRSVYVEQDAQNGTVYFFRVSVPYDAENDTHEPMEEFLSAQEAFEKAVPILKHFKLSTESSDYQIEPYFGTRPTLAEGSWSVKRQLTYNGVKCYKCWVEILVRAATKEVELISYRPPIAPRIIESRITKDEARDAVRKWLKEHWYFSECARAYVDESQDVTEIIHKLNHRLCR